MNNFSKIPFQQQKSPYIIIIPLFVLFGFSMIGVAMFSLKELLQPNDLNAEKQLNTSITQTVFTVPETPRELKLLEESKENSGKSVLAFPTLIIILLACSGGSLLMTYLLRCLVTDEPTNKKIREQKKTNFKKFNYSVTPKKNNHISQQYSQKNRAQEAIAPISVKTENQPIVTVVSPHESTPVEKREPTLAEILDLRKHRSLVSMMHDN